MHQIAESFFDAAWCLKEQPAARRLHSRGGEILCRPVESLSASAVHGPNNDILTVVPIHIAAQLQ